MMSLVLNNCAQGQSIVHQKEFLGHVWCYVITESAITPGKHQIPFYLEIKVFLNIYKPKYNIAIGLVYKKYLCKFICFQLKEFAELSLLKVAKVKFQVGHFQKICDNLPVYLLQS